MLGNYLTIYLSTYWVTVFRYILSRYWTVKSKNYYLIRQMFFPAEFGSLVTGLSTSFCYFFIFLTSFTFPILSHERILGPRLYKTFFAVTSWGHRKLIIVLRFEVDFHIMKRYFYVWFNNVYTLNLLLNRILGPIQYRTFFAITTWRYRKLRLMDLHKIIL